MRKVIAVQSEHFDLDSIRPKLESIVGKFAQYLDDYPIKTVRSKHALMGPVAKILERAQTRNWDAQSLTGYAMRVHEMNPKTRGFLNPFALQALEEGTVELVALCHEVPVTVVAKVVERIDYGVYYVRRKKGLERLEDTRQMFIRFLKIKYDSDFDRLAEAWGEKDIKDIKSFDGIRYPSAKNGVYKGAGPATKNDIDEFWTQYADQAAREEEDDENV